MESLKREITYGLRILVRNPLFAVIAILTLAIGIGANSAMFSAVYTVLLKPLPYKDPERLVFLFSSGKEIPLMTVSPPGFLDYSKSGPFAETAAMDTGTLDLTGKGDPERLKGAAVSWNFFHLLGVRPARGREFLQEEGKEGGNRVVLLSSGLWKRRFASDPKIVGSTIVLDGISWTVIGIAPVGFDYPKDTDVWRPLRFTAHEVDESQRGAHWLRVVARLAPNITFLQAQERVHAIATQLAKDHPRHNDESALIQPFHGFLVRKMKPALLVLWASVGFVLLIACVNVTNLLLAQAARRESEVAIRSALGAGRGRLLRQFLIESLVLSLSASILGVFIALWATELLNTYGAPTFPALADVHINTTVLLFTILISVTVGVLIGLVPALQNVQVAMPKKLKSGVRISSRNRIRRGLAIAEIATALILLAGAGLLIKSFYRLTEVDPGFRSQNILTFEVSLPDSAYPQPHQSAEFYEEFIRRLSAHPEVRSAGAVFGLPLTDGFNAHSSFEILGKPASSAEESGAGLRIVTSQYFQTMGIPILSGRNFQSSDTNESGDVVIISESAAKLYFADKNPLGQQIRIHVSLLDRKSGPCTIVGIVRNVHFEGLDEAPQPDLYLPHSQQPLGMMVMAVRTVSDPLKFVPTVREELRAIDPNLPLSGIQTMEDIVGNSISQRKFTMLLLAAFAGIGLFLAALGTYGVLAFQVVQRTQEIGIRMALGAAKKDVLRLVLQEGLFLAVAGTLIGFLGVLGTSRFLQSLLFGVSTLDASTVGAVVILLAAVAMFACYLPALRATKVDPITTLHYE